MHADQDPGRLLLLRVGHAHLQAEPRSQHRQDGARHDPGHQVVVFGICMIEGNFSIRRKMKECQLQLKLDMRIGVNTGR